MRHRYHDHRKIINASPGHTNTGKYAMLTASRADGATPRTVDASPASAPPRRRHREYLPLLQAATLVEWTGMGLFLAVSTIYFVKIVGLSTTEVGGGLTIAGAIAMVTTPLIARLADRYGPGRILVWVNIVRVIVTLGYLWVTGWWSFLLVAIGVAATEQAMPPLIQAFVGGQVRVNLRTRVMAIQRTVVNLGIGVGGLITGIALGSDSRSTFGWLLIGAASAYALVALIFMTFDPGRSRVSATLSMRALARDRRLIALTLYDTMLSLWGPMLNIAFPLCLVTETRAPARLVGILYAVNPVTCIALQYLFNRFSETSRRALVSYSAAALLLAAASVGFAVAPHIATTATVVVLAACVLALTLGELLQRGSAWTLSFTLAPENIRSQYLAVFNTARIVANRVAGPVLMTGVVLALGSAGWLGLTVMFLLAAVIPLVVVRRLSSDHDLIESSSPAGVVG